MNPTIYRKTTSATVAIKSLEDETGWFEGYASTFTKDLEGDRILKGAFRRTLSHKGGAAVPVLLNHDRNMIAGFNFEAKEDDIGLRVKGKLNLDTEAGRMAYHLLKSAVACDGAAGLSIGFQIPSGASKKNEFGGIDVSSLALKEYSVTPFPANASALVSTVKQTGNTRPSIKDRAELLAESRRKDFNEELDEQRVMSALYQERCDIERALSAACSDCMQNDMMSPDDKKAEIVATYEQYAAAMGDWYGRFIDADQDDDPEDDMEGMDGMDKNQKAGRQISAATADSIKAAMSHMADGAACHTKAIGILEDLSKRPYTANDVNMPNPAGGGKSADLDVAAIKQIVAEAVQEIETAKLKSQEGDSQRHSLVTALNSVASLIKKTA